MWFFSNKALLSLFSLLLFFPFVIQAETPVEIPKARIEADTILHGEKHQFHYQHLTLEEIAKDLSEKYSLTIVFTNESFKEIKIDSIIRQDTIAKVLNDIISPKELEFSIDNDGKIQILHKKHAVLTDFFQANKNDNKGFVWSDRNIKPIEKKRMNSAKQKLQKQADNLRKTTIEYRNTYHYVNDYTTLAYELNKEMAKPSWTETNPIDLTGIPEPTKIAYEAFENWAELERKRLKEAKDAQLKQQEIQALNKQATELEIQNDINTMKAIQDEMNAQEQQRLQRAQLYALDRIEWQLQTLPR